ncbi:MAG: outer membrane protein transport protein [Myxococcales bacterium]|nr:outer membrane protein transport protein [Myxococcales bacterium]
MSLLIGASLPSWAGSLDLIEVGGAWGSPGATNPTALWWNPAGLAAEGGTQFFGEIAPVSADVTVNRLNPDYGELQPFANFPTEYDYSGTDVLSRQALVPFLGLSSDFTLDRLGVGVGLYVPVARGGASDQELGANRFALREGNIQVVHASIGVAYQVLDQLGLGASVSLLDSTYQANVDTTIYPDLVDAIEEEVGKGSVLLTPYGDGHMENPGYSTTTVFDLKDQALTFGVGLRARPLNNDLLVLALAYNHGVRVDNSGTVGFDFSCPPEHDAVGRLGANQRGICDASFDGVGTIGYQLPSRFHFGVVSQPIDRVRIEAFGAAVLWNQFTDFDITTAVDASEVDVDDPEIAAETAALVSREQQWARDNRATFFVGLDGKAQLHRLLGLGARVTYDRSAVPDQVLSANNLDNDTVILSALAFSSPVKQLTLGLSFSQHLLVERSTTSSAYGVTLNDDEAVGPRYFYPSGAGTYGGNLTRIGIVLRGRVGGSEFPW